MVIPPRDELTVDVRHNGNIIYSTTIIVGAMRTHVLPAPEDQARTLEALRVAMHGFGSR